MPEHSKYNSQNLVNLLPDWLVHFLWFLYEDKVNYYDTRQGTSLVTTQEYNYGDKTGICLLRSSAVISLKLCGMGSLLPIFSKTFSGGNISGMAAKNGLPTGASSYSGYLSGIPSGPQQRDR